MAGGRAADVVVVGGGIIGCFVAYYLAQRGVRVVVVEATGIGSQASGRAAGIITPSWGPVPREILKLHPATFRMHVELATRLTDESGIDYGYELIPHVRLVFTEAGATGLRQWQREREAEGALVRWLAPEDARKLAPWLTCEPLGGVATEIEPQCDAFELVRAVARAARRRGAELVAGKVAGIMTEGDRVAGVSLEGGASLSAGAVVLAMGPWTGLAGEWLKMRLPVAPQRGQLFTLSEGADPTAGERVGVWSWDLGGFILPKRIGGTIIGTTREDGVGFDRSVTAEGRRTVVANAAFISGAVSEWAIVAERACLRPVSEDANPLIGAVPGWRGAYVASGHGGNGIHFGPVTGLAVAELIADGKTRFDMTAFRPDRFGVHAASARSGAGA
jgi:glycine oxidase